MRPAMALRPPNRRAGQNRESGELIRIVTAERPEHEPGAPHPTKPSTTLAMHPADLEAPSRLAWHATPGAASRPPPCTQPTQEGPRAV